jgi:phosphonate transport system ATP-binding protein
MAQGRVVFDGLPDDLTNETARALYGLEAGDVMDNTRKGRPEALTQAAAVAA